MKVPQRLRPLVEEGLVDDVLSQLMSGKEATVYVVRCGDDVRCAKVYKDAKQRSFKNAVSYTEGRKVKNSRQARAMEKGTRYGRQMQEELWQSAEVDALFKLAGAGVRVPTPYICTDGVLLMELVTDAEGHVAPRLNDVALTPERARECHRFLLSQVVRMLCAGVIHGDLSEYNILMAEDGWSLLTFLRRLTLPPIMKRKSICSVMFRISQRILGSLPLNCSGRSTARRSGSITLPERSQMRLC